MPTIVWHDGQVVTGKSWTAVEDQMRRDDWRSEGRLTVREYRRELQARAAVWADLDKNIRVGGTPEEFLRELERAGMLRIEDGEVRAPAGRLRKGAEIITKDEMIAASIRSIPRDRAHSTQVG